MDRALKERIVGAIVLVIFIVLVVPVFLDGPQEDQEVVSESVTLPGQNGQERKRQTIVLERDREVPMPAAATATREESDGATTEELQPTPVPDETAISEDSRDEPAETVAAAAPDPVPPEPRQPDPEPEPPRQEPAQSSTGMWAVQLGSFSNKENAERLAAELRGKGYAAFLSQLQNNGQQLHRVRIGPQKDRESAESTASRLSGEGHRGQVVPHP